MQNDTPTPEIRNNLTIPKDYKSEEISSDLLADLEWLTEEDMQRIWEMIEAERKRKEIPQVLKDFREAWEERINNISDENREKIIKAAETIPVKVETDSDGSRLVEFKLWNKTYKILDPRLENHTDDEYRYTVDYDSITHINRDYVKLWWMKWDMVNFWGNRKLKEFVMDLPNWLHIPKIEEMKTLLRELGEKADLYSKEYQIAMLMYLTWMDGWYWLSMWDHKASGSQASRCRLICDDKRRWFNDNRYDNNGASLCLIACK